VGQTLASAGSFYLLYGITGLLARPGKTTEKVCQDINFGHVIIQYL
jgi:hypothetical protein